MTASSVRHALVLSAMILTAACAAESEGWVPASPSTSGNVHPSAPLGNFESAGQPLAVLVERRGASGGEKTYRVALVSSEGAIVASVQPVEPPPIAVRFVPCPQLPQTAPSCTETIAPPMPLVSISRSRVYYLDGDSTVRYIGLDGSRGVAVHLVNGPHTRSAFSVSSDDRRVAIARFDYAASTTWDPARESAVGPGNPAAAVQIEVRDLQGGGHHVDIFASTSRFEWPVGWHAGRLALAVGHSTLYQTNWPNPYNASEGYHLVDPSSGHRFVSIGSDCFYGALVAAGTACDNNRAQSLEGITTRLGSPRDPRVIDNASPLSPDGTRQAPATVDGGQPFGWVDGSHVFVVGLGGPDSPGSGVMDTTTGKLKPISGGTEVFEFFGVVPSAL